ncbi:hypothetical protein MCEHALHM7_00542 [Methylophilaceae bacterium]
MEYSTNGMYCGHMIFMCLLMTAFFSLGIASFVKYLFFTKKK